MAKRAKVERARAGGRERAGLVLSDDGTLVPAPGATMVLSTREARILVSPWALERGLIRLDADGRLVLDYERVARSSRQTRMRLMLQVLEGHAMEGDKDAAKAALAHHRWAEEMATGKAVQPHEVRSPYVDDLARPSPPQLVESQHARGSK